MYVTIHIFLCMFCTCACRLAVEQANAVENSDPSIAALEKQLILSAHSDEQGHSDALDSMELQVYTIYLYGIAISMVIALDSMEEQTVLLICAVCSTYMCTMNYLCIHIFVHIYACNMQELVDKGKAGLSEEKHSHTNTVRFSPTAFFNNINNSNSNNIDTLAATQRTEVYMIDILYSILRIYILACISTEHFYVCCQSVPICCVRICVCVSYLLCSVP